MDGGFDDSWGSESPDSVEKYIEEKFEKLLSNDQNELGRVIKNVMEVDSVNLKHQIKEDIRNDDHFLTRANLAQPMARIFSAVMMGKIVNKLRTESGYCDTQKLADILFKFQTDLEYIIRSAIADNSQLTHLDAQIEKIWRDAGLIDDINFEEKILEVREEMKPIFDMLADPQLALSERVKAFQLA